MANEIWKDIDDFDGYQVSNMGRVRSSRGCNTKGWRILQPSLSVLDLARVTLYKDGQIKPKSVGRLVAAAFIQADLDGMIVMRRDADPMNNRVDNLIVIPRRGTTDKQAKARREAAVKSKDLPGEVWQTVKELDGRFAVSNMGRIKNLWQTRRNPILHQMTSKRGYKLITVQINGRKITKLVHRLVAYYFCPRPADFHEHSNRYYQVNHKDENTSNNRADNLEWCTAKYNINYGCHNERVAKALGTEVWQYDMQGRLVGKFVSISSAARAMGKKDAEIRIRECLEDDTTTFISYGYYWRRPDQPLKLVRGVEQLDLQGHVVAKYKTMADAARATGAKLASICRVTRGQQDTSVGYRWRRAMVHPAECSNVGPATLRGIRKKFAENSCSIHGNSC